MNHEINAQSQTKRQRRVLDRYGSWAVVTGASSGIGREMACRLAECGVHLVLVSRRDAALADLGSSLSQRYHIECRPLAVDLANPDAVHAVVKFADGLDVGLLVCAAGFGSSGPYIDNDLADELDMLALNCRAVTALTWHFARRFAAQRRGGIVLFSSLLAFHTNPD